VLGEFTAALTHVQLLQVGVEDDVYWPNHPDGFNITPGGAAEMPVVVQQTSSGYVKAWGFGTGQPPAGCSYTPQVIWRMQMVDAQWVRMYTT
jgi:hypothetical protein